MRVPFALAFLAPLVACAHAPAPAAPADTRAAVVSTTASAKTADAPVGFRITEGVDPLTHAPMPMVFFYPAVESARGAKTEIGPYLLSAAKNAPPAIDGLHPLVVVSHGHKGSMFGHYDLCEALARRGYVVGAAEHVGDSWRDSSGFRTDRTLLGRAYQTSAVIDAVLADDALGSHVDRARIGVAGFSAGGYTSLLLVGAHPDFSLAKGYCERHPADVEVCSGPVRMVLPQPTPLRWIRA